MPRLMPPKPPPPLTLQWGEAWMKSFTFVTPLLVTSSNSKVRHSLSAMAVPVVRQTSERKYMKDRRWGGEWSEQN